MGQIVTWPISIAGVLLVVVFAAWVIRSSGRVKRAEEKRKSDIARRIRHAAKKGPFFYETARGDTLVMVRASDHDQELARWQEAVASGEKKPGEKILLAIPHSACFFGNEASRENLFSIAARRFVQDIKKEAIRLASGLTERELQEVWHDPVLICLGQHPVAWISVATPHIFVPFSSQGLMSFDEQHEFFHKFETPEQAREYLLAEVPRPEQEI